MLLVMVEKGIRVAEVMVEFVNNKGSGGWLGGRCGSGAV